MNRDAIFSPCRKWRYVLWREWDCDLLTGCSDDLPNADKFVQFIGLNPSRADEVVSDSTLTRCVNFAKSWGYGSMVMTNLFGYRATYVKDMKAQDDPVGCDNDQHLSDVASRAGLIVCAWGLHGRFKNRDAAVLSFLPSDKLMCLRLTKGGFPEHPLYIPAITQPVRFQPKLG